MLAPRLEGVNPGTLIHRPAQYLVRRGHAGTGSLRMVPTPLGHSAQIGDLNARKGTGSSALRGRGHTCGEGASSASGLLSGVKRRIKLSVLDHTENAVCAQNTVFTLWLMSFDLCEFGLIITQLKFPVSQSEGRCDRSHFSILNDQSGHRGLSKGANVLRSESAFCEQDWLSPSISQHLLCLLLPDLQAPEIGALSKTEPRTWPAGIPAPQEQ